MRTAPIAVREKIKACSALERRKKVFALHRSGQSPNEIAKTLELRPAVVRADIAAIYDSEAEHLKEIVKRGVVMALVQIDDLYHEARTEWERSKKRRTERIRKVEDGVPTREGPITKTTTSRKSETGLGDPRYLSEARMLVQQKLRLLGLENPEKLQVEQIVRLTSDVNVTHSLAAPSMSVADLTDVATIMAQLGMTVPGLPQPVLPAPSGDSIDAEFDDPTDDDQAPDNE